MQTAGEQTRHRHADQEQLVAAVDDEDGHVLAATASVPLLAGSNGCRHSPGAVISSRRTCCTTFLPFCP